MRAIAAIHQFGPNPAECRILDAKIVVLHRAAPNGKRLYRAEAPTGDAIANAFTSLHRAKNAIRRHFRIASRKELLWFEEQV